MSKYMRYETGVKTASLRPLSIKRSNNISKATSGQLVSELYHRHDIIIWQVLATLAFTWAFVTKLG